MPRPAPVLLGILICLAAGETLARAAGPGRPGPGAFPARTGIVALDSTFDANELRMTVSNVGSFGYDDYSAGYRPGLEWPRGSGRNLMFAGGLWIGARVNGETRVTVAEYGSEFAAGPLDAGGQPVDPNETDPAHRVYKIHRGDGPANPDWAQWPIALGAPSDGAGNPRVIGDQTLWSVYNDAIASKHTLRPGSTTPLGLEVRQTVFGFDRAGPLGRMVFIEFVIMNRGPAPLDSTYVGLWCDPDLGSAQDDLVGCDPALDLGYCYNGDNQDGVYGSHPPALGIVLLKGPAVTGADLPMTGFGRLLKNYLEPDTPAESYGRFVGIREDGSLQTCEGVPTRFEVSADPVLDPAPPDTAWRAPCMDVLPADRRLLLSSGPFDFGPGTSRRVVIAILAGGRDGIGDRLGNLERLRSYSRVAREVYLRNFENIGTATEVDPGDLYLGQRDQSLAFDGRRTVAGSGPAPSYVWDFGDGGVNPGIGLQASHTYAARGLYRATLHALNTDIPVSCGVKVDIYDPAAATTSFADATRTGLSEVVSSLGPFVPSLFRGVDWGGRFFGGGLDTGCRWSGSSITGETGDRPLCPGAVHSPERFKRVRLTYGNPQRAYRYFRRELPSGAEPAAGHGYTFQGYVEIPFQATADLDGTPVQLQVMFTERQITDDLGNPAGLAQPVSQDGIWFPSAAPDGDHEYLSILDIPYSATPHASLTVDGAFFAGTAPVLYGGRLRLNPAGDLRPGAGVEFLWVNGADPRPGLDAAWAPIGNYGLGYFLSNGDGTSRLFHPWPATQSLVDYGIQIPASIAGSARSAAWGDYDSDGIFDLYLVGSSAPNHLLRQSLDGSSGEYGFGEVVDPPLEGPGTSTHASWVDYDLDGVLDLYLVNGPNPNRMLRKGALGFFDATTAALAGQPGGVRATWVDYDGDLDPDLSLSQGAAGGLLLRNDRDAGFVDVTPTAYAWGPHQDAAWGDFDGDGDLDVYLVRDGNYVNTVLRNDGAGGFVEATPGGLEGLGNGRRALWVDFDLDADLDLVLVDWATGFHLKRNTGAGVFVDASALLPTPQTVLQSVAAADYDQDGDPDFLLTGSGPDFLARNELVGGRWIQVTLEGSRSQRQGIGARIRVVAGGVRQVRYVTAADPPPLAATFGLGGAAVVDTVEVAWPSGAVSRMTAVPVFSRVTIQEDFQPPARLGLGRAYPNPSAAATRIELLIPNGVSAADVRIHDLAGREVWNRHLTDLTPGIRLLSWDGSDRDGRALPAGVYFVRVTHASGSASARIVRVR